MHIAIEVSTGALRGTSAYAGGGGLPCVRAARTWHTNEHANIAHT
jgi:hypothetical protein